MLIEVERMPNILIFEIFDSRVQSMNHKINLLLKSVSKKLLKKNYYSLTHLGLPNFCKDQSYQ